MKLQAFALVALLAPAPALAADGWSLAVPEGAAVMGEISSVQVRAENSAQSSSRINKLVLQLNAGNYDVDGGEAPQGWVVSKVDKGLRQITYTATGGCPSGIAPGASGLFTMRIIGMPAAADVAGDTFVTNGKKTTAFDTCAGREFPAPAAVGSWSRLGLSTRLAVSPRTLDVPESVTVRLTVTNRTTAAQNAIAPALPWSIGAGFTAVAGPTPASLSLAPEGTGLFTWTFRADSRGIGLFRAGSSTTGSASNGVATGPRVDSLQVDVGSFPASCDVFPDLATSGSLISLVTIVSNNTLDPLQSVSPVAPVLGGTAQAVLVSGPQPASVATVPAGAAVSFTWTYRVSGVPGQRFQFTTQASALRNGIAVQSDPAGSTDGRIVTHSASAKPSSLMAGSTSRTVAYTVVNGGGELINQVKLLPLDENYFSVAGAPFAADTSGWTTRVHQGWEWTAPSGGGIPAGGQQTFTLSLSAVGTPPATTSFSHRLLLTQADGNTVRVEAPVTVFLSRVVPEVSTLVAVSGVGRNSLVWNNPVDHDGVLIVRSELAPPDGAPVAGAQYAVGAQIGTNGRVVYSDQRSFVSSFADPGLAAGRRYYYKIYNHDEYFNYSPGRVPGPDGIFSEPTSRAAGTPLWCYSLGYPSTQQPVTESGAGVYTSGNLGAVTASLTSADEGLDGAERWRPTALSAPVQSRFPVVPLHGRSGKYILTADQSAVAYAIEARTGAIAWRGNGGAPLGERIQGQPMVQLYDYATAAFKAAHPGTDLVFLATRNSSATNNAVIALRSTDGSVAWRYAPGTMDIVAGGMLLDYANDRLWVPSWTNGGTQPSIRVISTLNGSLVTSFSGLGDLSYSLNMDNAGRVFATSDTGTVHAIDSVGLAPVWSQPLGGQASSWVFPTGRGFIAAVQGSPGAIKRFDVSGTTVTEVWSTPIASPTGLAIHFPSQKAYVGSSDGKVHQLDVATGADQAQLALTTGQVGTPVVDGVAGRLIVGMLDGRICAAAVPLPTGP